MKAADYNYGIKEWRDRKSEAIAIWSKLQKLKANEPVKRKDGINEPDIS